MRDWPAIRLPRVRSREIFLVHQYQTNIYFFQMKCKFILFIPSAVENDQSNFCHFDIILVYAKDYSMKNAATGGPESSSFCAFML